MKAVTILLNILMLIAGVFLMVIATANMVRQSDRRSPQDSITRTDQAQIKVGDTEFVHVWSCGPSVTRTDGQNVLPKSHTVFPDLRGTPSLAWSSSVTVTMPNTLSAPTLSFPNDSHPAERWRERTAAERVAETLAGLTDHIAHVWLSGSRVAMEARDDEGHIAFATEYAEDGRSKMVKVTPKLEKEIRRTWLQVK